MFYKVEKLKENVILLTIVDKGVFDLSNFKKMQSEIVSISNSSDFHLITDISKHTANMSKEASIELEKFQNINHNFKSCAIVLNSTWKSILLGTFLKITPMNVPTKSFISMEEAMTWIENLQDN